jgi:hypothetical protein
VVTLHHYKSNKKKEKIKMTTADFTVSKFSWQKVAEKVSELAGKPYNAHYVREVAVGYRSNKQLTIILQNLGIVKKEVA